MATKKISELTALTTPDGAEELVVNDNGTSKKITIDNIFNKSIDVTGTVTADGLTVDGDTGIGEASPDTRLHVTETINVAYTVNDGTTDANMLLKLENPSATAGVFSGIVFRTGGGADGYLNWVQGTGNDGYFVFNNQNTVDRELLKITSGGDISFYEDTGNTAKFFWDASAESLGIGTSNLNDKLTLDMGQMRLSDTYGIRWGDASAGIYGSGASDFLQFVTGSTEKMRIDSSGNILAGAFSGVGSTAGMELTAGSTGYTFNTSATISTSKQHFKFYNSNGNVGSITTSGSSTSYNTASDYRLKENVVPMTGSIDRLKELNPSRFNFITDADTTVDGFLAHEAGEVVPEAISGTKDAMRDEEYEVTPATGDVFIPAVEEVTEERQVTETVETGSYVNLAGETITETTEQPVTTEVTTTVIERQDIDGVMTEVEVERVTQEPVMETVVTTEAVAEQILESGVVQPETLPEGAQWRETTAAVMGTRQVEDYQGIDQAKIVPLLVAALQEAVARIETLETA